eukprot:jgi/Mesvir1/29143/Mv18438-RA.1
MPGLRKRMCGTQGEQRPPQRRVQAHKKRCRLGKRRHYHFCWTLAENRTEAGYQPPPAVHPEEEMQADDQPDLVAMIVKLARKHEDELQALRGELASAKEEVSDEKRARTRLLNNEPQIIALERSIPVTHAGDHKKAVEVWLETYSCSTSRKIHPPLIMAARTGRVDIVKHFIGFGEAVDHVDDGGNTALLVAVENGHAEVVKCLINSGAQLDNIHRRSKDMPLLNIAAAKGFVDMVDMLLAASAGVSRAAYVLSTALHAAVDKGHADVVARLLQAGAVPDRCKSGRGGKDWTELHMAAADGYIAIVDALLSAGADVNAKASYGSIYDETPLYVATDANVMRSLLRAPGVQVDMVHRNNGSSGNATQVLETPLQMFLKAKRWDLAALLLEAGADITTHGSDHAAMEAIVENVELLELMLRKGAANVNQLGPCLDAAVKGGSMPAVEALLQGGVGAKPNCPGGVLEGALYLATKARSATLVKRLLQAGADPNLVSPAGPTPLYVAADKGALELVKCLLEAGANPNATGGRSHASEPVLFAAVRSRNVDIVKCLVDGGMDVHKSASAVGRHDSYSRGRSIFELATGQPEMMECLQALGLKK